MPATPRPEHLAAADKVVASWTDAQVAAYLTGNWRHKAAPPLAEFVRHCLIVEKETGNLIPFELWPEQEAALAEIEAHPYLIAAKGRQIGITWLEEAAMLHAGTFHGHRAFPIARQNEEYAKDGIRRLLYLAGYDPDSDAPNLRVLPESPMPPEWRPKVVAKNVTEIRFENGSYYKALTATQQIGRGGAWYWGLADEYAFWMNPAKQRAALESGCARLHVVSTGNGEGDDFHLLWQKAEGGGKWHPLFIPADADPRRDAEFFRQNVDEATDPDLARREWARRVEDVFRAPEGTYFKRFDRERHVADVEAIRGWPTFRAVDFGYRHPACLWVQRAPSGQLFVVAEYLPEATTTPEFAAGITAMDAKLGTAATTQVSYCDPAGRAANVQTAESEFEVLRRAHLNPRGRPSSLRDGCVRMMDALADPELPLVVSSACPGLIAALSQVKPHRTRPECYDFDHEIHSHPLDALRYLFVNLPRAGTGGGSVASAVGSGRRTGGF